MVLLGDASKSPCLLVPEVGFPAQSCFQPLLLAAGGASLLLKNHYFIFIEPFASPEQTSTASLETVVHQILDVVAHYTLREVLGLGVGNGGYLLIKAAAASHHSLFSGLVLISPSTRCPGWWEWGMGHIAARQIARSGWTSSSARKHLAMRAFAMNSDDILISYDQDLKNLEPAKVSSYLLAALGRVDCLADVLKLECRVLLLYGADSLYKGDSEELSRTIKKDKFSILEFPGCGTALCQEIPGQLVSPIELFLTSLQLEGVGLGRNLMIGE